jgi:hypothetical protein
VKGRVKREESSFSEEKEAKRLLSIGCRAACFPGFLDAIDKSFCFFFQKEVLSSLQCYSVERYHAASR